MRSSTRGEARGEGRGEEEEEVEEGEKGSEEKGDEGIAVLHERRGVVRDVASTTADDVVRRSHGESESEEWW